jgi:hypothetical protein
LVFPFLCEFARFDPQATAEDPDLAGPLTEGYDPDFDEVVAFDPAGSVVREDARKDLPLLRISAQVRVAELDGLISMRGGARLKAKMMLTADVFELQAQGLVDATTGDILIRPNDKLVAIYRETGELEDQLRVPLYVNEVRAAEYGIGQTRNLVHFMLEDRRAT